MYVPQPNDKVPQPDTIIWRYVDLAKFVSMLDSQNLYFPSVRILAREDKWEAVFRARIREIWREHTGSDDFDRLRRHVRERAFVSCWHMNEHESDAMWKIYSEGGSNVVIRSTVGRLSNAVSSCTEVIRIAQVDYDHDDLYDYKKVIDSGANAKVLSITPLLLLWKRPSFEHEKELRAFHYAANPAPKTRGKRIRVDLRSLFDEIHVSPRSQPWFRRLVERVMAKYNLANIPVKQSSMDDEPER